MRKAGQKKEDNFDEAFRYWRNARRLLGRCPAEGDFYTDIKPVREAFGTAWLAIDTAVKAALKEKGVAKIPRSWDALLAAAARHLAPRNGRLVRDLSESYRQIHLAGYYYADLRARPAAEAVMDVALRVIERLSSRRHS